MRCYTRSHSYAHKHEAHNKNLFRAAFRLAGAASPPDKSERRRDSNGILNCCRGAGLAQSRGRTNRPRSRYISSAAGPTGDDALIVMRGNLRRSAVKATEHVRRLNFSSVKLVFRGYKRIKASHIKGRIAPEGAIRPPAKIKHSLARGARARSSHLFPRFIYYTY